MNFTDILTTPFTAILAATRVAAVLLCSLVLAFSMGAVGQQVPQQPNVPSDVPFAPTTSLTGTMQKAMALTTTPISIFCGDTLLGSATGFLFGSADLQRVFLITNRHVVIVEHPQPGQPGPLFPDHLVLRFHTSENDLKLSDNYVVPLYRVAVSPARNPTQTRGERLWREIDADTDVVAIELNRADIRRFSIGELQPKDILPADMSLALGESLVVIGYPLGFSDQMFNLPIAREGTVASVFPVPFQGKRFFLVDARLHPGTSGSPVLTRPSQWFVKGGLPRFNNGYVSYLVGINSGSFGDLNLNSVWFADIILELTK